MNAGIPSSIITLAQAAPAAQPISIQTALLIILGIALLFTVKSLAELHRKVAALSAQARPKSRPASAPGTTMVPPEVVAVISAAVYESLGTDHRIVTISAEGQGATWSMEGRRNIFSTRKVR